MDLIIVESPTKANTFNKFLKGGEYHVEATLGHIRDLPENKLSIDVKNDFKPDYIIVKKRQETVDKIKSLAKKADTIILATDHDREGEAISYHLAFLLGFVKEKWPESKISAGDKLKRIVFHEITEEAISEALKSPSVLNIKLVDSQQARRILDRMVGYKLSPLLWKKMGKRWLSAGRVQTVALRFIVEREREIDKFKKEAYFKVLATFSKKKDFEAKLVSKNDIAYEQKFTLDLFDGKYTYTKTTIDKSHIEDLKADLESDKYKVADVEENVSKRYPAAPYTTSTLQQDAARQFGYSSKVTMRLAQTLYEKGFITYHRTDSFYLSPKFLSAARGFIEKKYGSKYLPGTARVFKTTLRGAQEAHEAIRPTNLDVSEIKEPDITPGHSKLYNLIYRRALASQMKEAEVKTVKIKVIGDKGYLFETSWEEIMFDGYLILYPKAEDLRNKVDINVNDSINLKNLDFQESETMPPPRYNEASLIKVLEEKGIGRPSTYAPTISTIQDRQYVEKKENRFFPSFLGTTVCDYLSKGFPEIFEIDFTANMEEDLDSIADGEKNLVDVLVKFYKPFAKSLKIEEKDKSHIDVQEMTDEKCPTCGKSLLIRYSKFGKFLGCSGYPECKYTGQYVEKANVKCPKCAGEVIIKYTKRKRKFYGCENYPKCDFAAWRLNQIVQKTEDGKQKTG